MDYIHPGFWRAVYYWGDGIKWLNWWVNYDISLTWIKAIWGWFPLLTVIIVRSQWGRYKLSRCVYIYMNEWDHWYDIMMSEWDHGLDLSTDRFSHSEHRTSWAMASVMLRNVGWPEYNNWAFTYIICTSVIIYYQIYNGIDIIIYIYIYI